VNLFFQGWSHFGWNSVCDLSISAPRVGGEVNSTALDSLRCLDSNDMSLYGVQMKDCEVVYHSAGLAGDSGKSRRSGRYRPDRRWMKVIPSVWPVPAKENQVPSKVIPELSYAVIMIEHAHKALWLTIGWHRIKQHRATPSAREAWTCWHITGQTPSMTSRGSRYIITFSHTTLICDYSIS
jgi:hypothetical protein